MSTIEAGSKKLTSFGLTPYEAKVYLACVRLGLSTPGGIAKLTGIRREEVYRTLPRLEKAGFTERVLGRPVKVKALPPREALSLLVKRREEEARREVSDMNTRMEEFLASFTPEEEGSVADDSQSHFVLVSEKDSVATRVDLLVRKATTAIDVADSSSNILRFILDHGDILREAAKRNVKIRILTDCPRDEQLIPTALQKQVPGKSVSLRYLEGVPNRYLLLDQNQVLMATSRDGDLSDSKSLWTDDGNLVDLIRSNFNDLARKSVDWKQFRRTPFEKMERALEDMKPRDHAILVYDTLEAKHKTLFRYVAIGLRKGEAARYICSEESCDEIKRSMSQQGIDVDGNERTGALGIIDYTDFYIKNGRFSLEDVMSSWDRIYRETAAGGFSGLRVTGETTCFMKHSLVNELVSYEKALHTVLDVPMIAICAYNANVLSATENAIDVYSELVRAHGKVLFADSGIADGKIEIRA